MDDVQINLAVGAELRAARARRNLSRAEVEELAGVPTASLQRYENGQRAVPMPTLMRLLKVLGITLGDIETAIQRAAEGQSDPPAGESPAERTRRAFSRKSAQERSHS